MTSSREHPAVTRAMRAQSKAKVMIDPRSRDISPLFCRTNVAFHRKKNRPAARGEARRRLSLRDYFFPLWDLSSSSSSQSQMSSEAMVSNSSLG
jgi:hypothetical protein